MTKKTAAEVLLTTCSDAKPDEKLVFVTDPRSMDIALKMWEAAEAFPNKVMVMMTERTMHGQNTPPTVAAAMKEADVIIAKGMGNTETMYGCGYNVYYAFLVKCSRFVQVFGQPKLTPMLVRERT